jgi:hypothetical protein
VVGLALEALLESLQESLLEKVVLVVVVNGLQFELVVGHLSSFSSVVGS